MLGGHLPGEVFVKQEANLVADLGHAEEVYVFSSVLKCLSPSEVAGEVHIERGGVGFFV